MGTPALDVGVAVTSTISFTLLDRAFLWEIKVNIRSIQNNDRFSSHLMLKKKHSESVNLRHT